MPPRHPNIVRSHEKKKRSFNEEQENVDNVDVVVKKKWNTNEEHEMKKKKKKRKRSTQTNVEEYKVKKKKKRKKSISTEMVAASSSDSKYIQDVESDDSDFDVEHPALKPDELILSNLPAQTKKSHVLDFFKNIDADVAEVRFRESETIENEYAKQACVTFKSLSSQLLKQALELNGEQMLIRNGRKVLEQQTVYISRSKKLHTVFVSGFDATKNRAEIMKLLRKIFGSFVVINDIFLAEDRSYAYMLAELNFSKKYTEMIDCGYIKWNGAELTVREARLKRAFMREKWSSIEVPNGMGFLLGTLQLLIYAYYRNAKPNLEDHEEGLVQNQPLLSSSHRSSSKKIIKNEH